LLPFRLDNANVAMARVTVHDSTHQLMRAWKIEVLNTKAIISVSIYLEKALLLHTILTVMLKRSIQYLCQL
jgi:hypothetical protein